MQLQPYTTTKCGESKVDVAGKEMVKIAITKYVKISLVEPHRVEEDTLTLPISTVNRFVSLHLYRGCLPYTK